MNTQKTAHEKLEARLAEARAKKATGFYTSQTTHLGGTVRKRTPNPANCGK